MLDNLSKKESSFQIYCNSCGGDSAFMSADPGIDQSQVTIICNNQKCGQVVRWEGQFLVTNNGAIKGGN